MGIVNTSTTPTMLSTASGELIYELVGRTLIKSSIRHSVAHVVVPPGKSSRRHYHPEAEESYYVMQGMGLIQIENVESILSAGDEVLIPAQSAHKVFNCGEEDLVLMVVCVPAWEPSNTVWLENIQYL
jgi:mannose-6-phosphate isomerase-like protein (cupin superfamily)